MGSNMSSENQLGIGSLEPGGENRCEKGHSGAKKTEQRENNAKQFKSIKINQSGDLLKSLSNKMSNRKTLGMRA